MNPRLVSLGLATVLVTSWARAQDTAFTYQGHLLEGGAPAEGSYSMRFQLYTAETEGSPASDPLETAAVSVAEGLFTVLLDWGVAAFEQPDLWLEIEVRTNSTDSSYVRLSPRQQVTAVPRALVAYQAAVATQATTISSGAVTSDTIAPNSILATHIAEGQLVTSLNGLHDEVQLEAGTNILLSLTGPSSLAIHNLSWGLQGNGGTDPATHFIGTTDPVPLELRVNAERVLRLERTTNYGNRVNVIAGHSDNHVPSPFIGIVIAGGGAKYGDSVDGDWTHQVESDASTISGGMANRIGTNSTFATIAGGLSNVITSKAFEAVIGGGRQNRIEPNADHGVIAGGLNNTLGEFSYFSTVSGGWTNRILGVYSTISGGVENYVGGAGHYSTIGGGAQNRVEDGTITGTIAGGGNNVIRAESRRSSIGGGKSNEIHERSPHSTIGGGLANTIGADAEGAVIPGGISNRVDGIHAFAAGHLAQAAHPGAFVWADGNPFPFPSIAPNEVAVRATGGVRLISAVDAGGVPTAGVVLDPGSGSWSALSDRRAKTAFESIDPNQILEQVNELPIQTWQYRAEAESTRHLGPTAQDFHQAFRLGTGDRTISMVDADGVSLAAIQGLYRRLQQQEAEIRKLRRQLEQLESVTHRRSEPPGGAKSTDPVSE